MFEAAGTLRKGKLSWPDRLKIVGKVLIGRLCVVWRTGRPIFLFSTRRSGSTLLMQLIHSQPGVDYIDEPLNLWRLHPHFQRLPHPPSGRFISVTSAHEEGLLGYVQELLSGKLRFRHRGNLVDAGRTYVVRRFVMKNINATPLIDWFAEKFDADVVYLVRHPGAVADSLVRRNWGSAAHAYLSDEEYCDRYLTCEQKRFAQDILDWGNPFEQCVLEWCLDNVHALSVWKERPWLTLSYEELVLRSAAMASLLCKRLELPDPEGMCRVLQLPSRTASLDSKRVVQADGPKQLVTRWLEHIPESETRTMSEVLAAFGIGVYKADTAYPLAALCHFGSFPRTSE